MKQIFKPGDTKVYCKTVTDADQATFHNEVLHRVCSTFALARDFEWSSRLFFIEMKEDHEEGVGTLLLIEHKTPAFVGEEVVFTATIDEMNGNEMICSIEARVNDRLVATGKTGQKMLTRDKLSRIFKHPY
jgi:fluoroacetyl-CoA thioesterase